MNAFAILSDRAPALFAALAIHEGKCAGVRALCTRNEFFTKCAYDGQCAASDKCCYDACVGRHICKSAV